MTGCTASEYGIYGQIRYADRWGEALPQTPSQVHWGRGLRENTRPASLSRGTINACSSRCQSCG